MWSVKGAHQSLDAVSERGREWEGHEHFVVVFASHLERSTLELIFLESGGAVKPTSDGV
jgi:hypothetical protein